MTTTEGTTINWFRRWVKLNSRRRDCSSRFLSMSVWITSLSMKMRGTIDILKQLVLLAESLVGSIWSILIWLPEGRRIVWKVGVWGIYSGGSGPSAVLETCSCPRFDPLLSYPAQSTTLQRWRRLSGQANLGNHLLLSKRFPIFSDDQYVFIYLLPS